MGGQMYAALTPHTKQKDCFSRSQCSNLSVAPRLNLIINLAYLNGMHIGPKNIKIFKWDAI